MVEPLYRLGVRHRNRTLERHPPNRVDRPVISIGNLTVGGTGKTPAVIWLCQRLLQRGRRPAVLTRGFRAHSGNSDEATEIAEAFRHSPTPVHVRVNPDRLAAALEQLRAHPDTDVFVLDDGFQHRRLARDVDIVLIDATDPFGGGRLLPRGRLREPLTGLSRASAVILSRCDQTEPHLLEAIERTVHQHAPHAPVARAVYQPTHVRIDRHRHELGVLTGRRVLAFCGIGSPESFFRSLRTVGLDLVDTEDFADHHRFTPAELEQLLARARRHAAIAMTTSKDAARLPESVRDQIAVVEGAMSVVAGEATLIEMVDAAFDFSGRTPTAR